MTFDPDYEPFFQPPGWIVGPVWLVLYTCIAISFSTTLSKRDELDNYWIIVSLFIIQLALNLIWPSVFFNSQRYLLSLIMLVFMIIFTLIYAFLIYKTIPYASMLVWPYIAWVSFAALINAAYYIEARG